MKISLTKAQRIKILSSQNVYSIMQAVLLRQTKIRRKQEYVWTIGLNEDLDIEYIELVALGKLNTVTVEPVELFSIAVQKRCTRLILVHNHPTGNLKPSKTDLALTKSLKAASKILKIEIIDHLIISEKGYMSFADDGLL